MAAVLGVVRQRLGKERGGAAREQAEGSVKTVEHKHYFTHDNLDKASVSVRVLCGCVHMTTRTGGERGEERADREGGRG